MEAQSDINHLLDTVRAGRTAAGLHAVGRFAFGFDCAIVTNGVGLRAHAGQTDFATGAGRAFSERFRVEQDSSLEALGLSVIVTETARLDLTKRAKVAMLLYRAGLLLRILDLSFAHLSGRVSGGQKTLHHQLVKSTFAESFALAETIRTEAPHLLTSEFDGDLSAQHQALNVATSKAAKLMGGHGFLAGQVNALEFLSMCTFSQAAQASVPLRREVAA